MKALLTRAVFVTVVAFGIATFQSAVAYGTGVIVNGHHLTPAELMALQRQIGSYIAPGVYQVDPRTGCWMNVRTGQYGCLGRGSSSPADRWVSPEELSHGGLRGVRPGPLTTYDFVR